MVYIALPIMTRELNNKVEIENTTSPRAAAVKHCYHRTVEILQQLISVTVAK